MGNGSASLDRRQDSINTYSASVERRCGSGVNGRSWRGDGLRVNKNGAKPAPLESKGCGTPSYVVAMTPEASKAVSLVATRPPASASFWNMCGPAARSSSRMGSGPLPCPALRSRTPPQAACSPSVLRWPKHMPKSRGSSLRWIPSLPLIWKRSSIAANPAIFRHGSNS